MLAWLVHKSVCLCCLQLAGSLPRSSLSSWTFATFDVGESQVSWGFVLKELRLYVLQNKVGDEHSQLG